MTLDEVKKLLIDHNIEFFIKKENKNLVSVRLWVEEDDSVSKR